MSSINRLFVLAIAFLLTIPSVKAKQRSAEAVKDSLKAIACLMSKSDQEIRQALNDAEKTGNESQLRELDNMRDSIDRANIKLLGDLIRTVGFPCPKLFGRGTCYPFDVLYHWSKEFPESFNDPETTKYFKKEIEQGHLPLAIMDMAYFLFVSYTSHDMTMFEPINTARKSYGLVAYTKDQFMRKETITPLVK